AAAAAVILFIGIFYWNYSGKTDVKKDGSLAKIDTLPKNNGAAPDQKSNDKIANNNASDSAPQIINANNHKHQFANNNSQTHKHISTIKWNSKVATAMEKTPFTTIAFNSNLPLLKSHVNPQVDFTDAYYDYAYESDSPVAVTEISMRQAAMRWMKRKLDHSSKESDDENMVLASYDANNSKNTDVTGFDLTSSAVNRLGEATGTNIHLGKEDEGTILTLGKYKVLLNHKR
ncbi:MAG TPA: hypothetical protein VFJ43_12920, partial [Bacteroidia bacterium]|nr:hypothetical protein [Bacteroidia bacterium]